MRDAIALRRRYGELMRKQKLLFDQGSGLPADEAAEFKQLALMYADLQFESAEPSKADEVWS